MSSLLFALASFVVVPVRDEENTDDDDDDDEVDREEESVEEEDVRVEVRTIRRIPPPAPSASASSVRLVFSLVDSVSFPSSSFSAFASCFGASPCPSALVGFLVVGFFGLFSSPLLCMRCWDAVASFVVVVATGERSSGGERGTTTPSLSP